MRKTLRKVGETRCNARSPGDETMRLPVLGLIVLTAGCGHVQSQNQGDPAMVEDVVNKIKVDIERYQRYAAVASLDAALPNACGGKINFLIDNVKVQLTTQSDDRESGSASLTLPVGSSTFEPLFSKSRETKGTQTLTFSLFPKPVSIASNKRERASDLDPIDAGRFPIAAALQRLREGLLKVSNETPCFDLFSESNAAASISSFSFGFSVVNNVTSGGTLKLVVLSLGATQESQRQASNTLTVSFTALADSRSFKLF